MLRLERTNASNTDFIALVKLLDKELAITDGDDHDFYHQFNGIENIHYVVLGYIENKPVACGAIKKYDAEYMEVKRMYVLPGSRGNSYAVEILTYLEEWARELGFQYCILETGINQKAAIRLYHKAAYSIIENYGQYAGVPNSFCFKKNLM